MADEQIMQVLAPVLRADLTLNERYVLREEVRCPGLLQFGTPAPL
eukprot:SAG31_NODE_44024_length_264_cov_1.218182_1_plen_45_part_00